MSHGFATNRETLLVLGWVVCQPGLREQLIEAKALRKECKPLLCSKLTSDVPSLIEFDPVYGSAYARLFLHSLDQIDYTYVDWSLRGYSSVYLKSDEGATSENGASGSTEETALLMEAITQNDRLMTRLKRLSRSWNGDVGRGPRLLRLHFIEHLPPLAKTMECPWLVHELLVMSLSCVAWGEVAARLFNVSYAEQSKREGEDDRDKDRLAIT